MKILRYKEKIEELLLERQDVRDNDLYLYFWLCRRLGIDLTKITGFDLIRGMKRGEYPYFESVRRTRQKLQEECPLLRGKYWNQRHGKEDKEVQEELAYIYN